MLGPLNLFFINNACFKELIFKRCSHDGPHSLVILLQSDWVIFLNIFNGLGCQHFEDKGDCRRYPLASGGNISDHG